MASIEDLVKALTAVMETMDAGGGKGGAGRRRRSLEEKYYKRVDSYKGVQQDLREWSFQVKNVTRSYISELADVLEAVGLQEEYDFSKAAVETSEVDTEEDELKQASREFFGILCIMCTGEALMIVRGAASGDGAEAWYRLKKIFYPNTMASTLRKVMAVVATQEVEMRNLVGAVEKWDGSTREVEKDMGKELPEMVKVAELVQMCPRDIQDILLSKRID